MSDFLPPAPLRECQVQIPFHPTFSQDVFRRAARWISRCFPVPRAHEVDALSRQVCGALPVGFSRCLFGHSVEQAALLLMGGWNQLDLSPLQDLDVSWKEKGKGTLFLSMHHGNWEWLAGILFALRSDTLGVARSAHHPLGQSLLRHVRHFHRTPVFYDREGYRLAHRRLKEGGLVAFLADQRPPSHGEPGSWLGHPTLVSPLPRLWVRDELEEFWVGQLIPLPTNHFRLDLIAYPATALAQWDHILDIHFLEWVRAHPELHFGFFHRRLGFT